MSFSEGVNAITDRLTGIKKEKDPITGRVDVERFKGPIGGNIFPDNVVHVIQDVFDRILRSENGDNFVFALLEGKAWAEVVGTGREREVIFHYINNPADLTVARECLSEIFTKRMAGERPFDPI